MPETKSSKVTVEKTAAKDTISTTRIQSLFPANVIYIGRISGQRYVFPESGSILDVDSRDVPDMLAYRIGTSSCCGGTDPRGNFVFQILNS